MNALTASLSKVHERAAAVVCAALFGTFLVFGVGFAHSDTVHNAAHDTRHSLAFPCH